MKIIESREITAVLLTVSKTIAYIRMFRNRLSSSATAAATAAAATISTTATTTTTIVTAAAATTTTTTSAAVVTCSSSGSSSSSSSSSTTTKLLLLLHCLHVTPLLKQLHWLPIQTRIDYKLATLFDTLMVLCLSISLQG